MGSLEMLALEMKQMGTFVARTLSWDGAEFATLHIPLDPEQVKQYDSAAQWWLLVKKDMEEIIQTFFSDQAPSKTLWRAYWSAHQRFFREMSICAKVPSVVREVKQFIAKDCAIVIGLQSTGEASTQAALEEFGEQMVLDSQNESQSQRQQQQSNNTIDFEEIVLPSLVSTCRSIMTSFVRNHYPVALPPLEPPKVPTMPADGVFQSDAARMHYMMLHVEAERIQNLPPPAPIPVLVHRRRAVLDATRTLQLPPNPLDDLIHQLGGTSQVRF
jgi:hypothetical protein